MKKGGSADHGDTEGCKGRASFREEGEGESYLLIYGRPLGRFPKPKKLAVIAAMRKLLLIAHAVYKSKADYCEAR